MKQKKMIAGTQTGSLINHVLSGNSTTPVVGQGATILHWSDREPARVVWVSDDKKVCTIEHMNAKRTDNNGMSEDQEYKYTSSGHFSELKFSYGAWRKTVKEILYTDEVLNMALTERVAKFLHKPPTEVIKGYTFTKTTYPIINIIFGKMEKYHDPSF